MNKPELLAPAGNLLKLKLALTYGADAVYLAGKRFGMRAKADNFSNEEIVEGVAFAHQNKKRVYVTLNIIPHESDFEGLAEFISFLYKTGVDAVIVSDPGIISLVKETAPGLRVNLSTQANNLNSGSAKFWYDQGIKRITLARELSFSEIKDIISKSPNDLEFESFIHGSICISYSGRCMLSSYMTGRDANRGICAHPCRYSYQLIEEKRPNETFPVYEDETGTYIFNSRDLCLIKKIPELIRTGLSSFKIEGRMKSAYYTALASSVYRKAIDLYVKDPEAYKYEEEWMDELKKVTNRTFTEGFFSSVPDNDDYVYDINEYVSDFVFAAVIEGYDKINSMAKAVQQNKISLGESIEIMLPGGGIVRQEVEELYDSNMNKIESTPHPQQEFYIKVDKPVKEYCIIRKRAGNK